MTIDLSKITFENDFFSTMLPDGKYLVLNKIDESMKYQNVEVVCNIKVINIEVQDVDGNATACPCIIGIGNDIMQINTDHTEYEGEVLTPDNMVFCTIEVYE